MINYLYSTKGLIPEQLQGFFVGWPDPPSSQTHLQLLHNSDEVVIAVDDSSAKVVGFVTAITDGVLSAYIPFLEVLPGYRHRGIGKHLMTMMLERLRDYYMIDLSCDEQFQSFYEQLGLHRGMAMMSRNYGKQSSRII
jgi:ribosomal protein S18 acetylase RimI-like enzyme